MQKSWVKYSGFVWILTLGATAVIAGASVVSLRNDNLVTAIICWAVLLIVFIGALAYAPIWVAVTDGLLILRRPLSYLRIPVDEIAEIKRHSPTMGEKRLLGSGGWFGYWGWFMEADTGRYFADYGKASDCFMVTLKDGRKYLLSCTDPDRIIKQIESEISH